MIRALFRATAVTVAATAGITVLMLWQRRKELRAEWDANGVRVQHTDGTARADITGAPYGLATKVRSRQGVTDDVRTAPPPWEPALLTWLANWQPAAPASLPGKVLGIVWAAPMSLAGLIVGLASGARPRLDASVVLFAGVGGPAESFLSRRGFTAATWGHVVLSRAAQPSARLMAHELVHTRQAERLGPLMPVVYLGLMPVYGYSRHPMERAARQGSGTAGTP